MNMHINKAVIDLDAIAHNIRALRKIIRPGAELMAVVKANAYGHGCIPIAETAIANGASVLGVARIEEGLLLRKAGITAPVLIFGHIPKPQLHLVLEYDMTVTIFSSAAARTVSAVASEYGRRIRTHVKIDTGMGRLGLLPDAKQHPEEVKRLNYLASDIIEVSKLPGIDLEGIYTHFATADTADKQYALNQFNLFLRLLGCLKEAGLEIPVRHAANSGAIINLPETHLDLVRPGITIYGLYPSKEIVGNHISLQPAMSLSTRIIHLKEVPAHFKVSYGCVQETEVPTVIATVPVGYADGYNRLFSCTGHMLVHGKKAPVIGRVCMDLTMLDVGHIPEAALDDEVVVFGEQNGATITVDELADTIGTINYEIITSVSDRIPREYVRGPKSEIRGQV